MPTLLQLSATTLLNVDAITLLRCEAGQWRVWLASPEQSLALTDDELAVLLAWVDRNMLRGLDVWMSAVRRSSGV